MFHTYEHSPDPMSRGLKRKARPLNGPLVQFTRLTRLTFVNLQSLSSVNLHPLLWGAMFFLRTSVTAAPSLFRLVLPNMEVPNISTPILKSWLALRWFRYAWCRTRLGHVRAVSLLAFCENAN